MAALQDLPLQWRLDVNGLASANLAMRQVNVAGCASFCAMARYHGQVVLNISFSIYSVIP